MKRVLFSAAALGGIGHFAALGTAGRLGYPRIAFAPPDGGTGGGLDLKALESQVATLGTEVKQATDKLQQSADKYLSEVKTFGQASADAKAVADKALFEANTATTRMATLEQ